MKVEIEIEHIDPDPHAERGSRIQQRSLIWIHANSDPQPCLTALKMCCNYHTHPASKTTIFSLAYDVLSFSPRCPRFLL
jgi:hypothetical protein